MDPLLIPEQCMKEKWGQGGTGFNMCVLFLKNCVINVKNETVAEEALSDFMNLNFSAGPGSELLLGFFMETLCEIGPLPMESTAAVSYRTSYNVTTAAYELRRCTSTKSSVFVTDRLRLVL